MENKNGNTIDGTCTFRYVFLKKVYLCTTCIKKQALGILTRLTLTETVLSIVYSTGFFQCEGASVITVKTELFCYSRKILSKKKSLSKQK